MELKMESELENFNDAMDVILKADPQAVKEAMEREKTANEEQRKAKKQPSALGPASTAKD